MENDIELTQTDFLNIERELCKRSFSYFVKQAWHVLEPTAELKWGWALDAICLHLEAVSSGKIKRLLINVPPGSMKSLLTSVLWPAWEWGALGRPSLRYIGTAHNRELATRDSRKCRDLIKSDWYQELWPMELMADLDGKQAFGNTKKGVRESCSFTSLTGVRGDRVILDDPISVHEANSSTALNECKRTFKETLPTRLNNNKAAVVVIMQRVHENDVSGVILAEKMNYVHLCIPMRYEKKNVVFNPIGWKDPRKKEGELMFPERFPEETVVELEKVLGSYGTAGQLQQRPTPRGGGLFKTEWINFYTQLPKLDFKFIVADTAQKTGTKNDYSVFQLWARSTTGQAYLIDQLRGKWEAPDLIAEARRFYNKAIYTDDVSSRNTPLRGFYVEDKVSGTGLIQTLRREGMAILSVQRDRDKYSRALDVAPFLESGNVFIPKEALWFHEFMGELEAFPNGAHDDQLDPMFDAVGIVQRTPQLSLVSNVIPLKCVSRW